MQLFKAFFFKKINYFIKKYKCYEKNADVNKDRCEEFFEKQIEIERQLQKTEKKIQFWSRNHIYFLKQ